MTKECTIEVDVEDGVITVKAKDCGPQTKIALYSYADTGKAEFDLNKQQTLIDHGQNKASGEFGCGLDFQVDVFKGDVIESVPTEMYGSRLVLAKHVEGPGECETPSTSSTSTTSTSTPSTSSTSTSTTSTSAPPAPPSSTPTTFREYTCELSWVANRDILADNFLEPWEKALDPDGNGIICETVPTQATTVTTLADPSATTSTSLLPFTGGHEVGSTQLGALLLLVGLPLAIYGRLRRSA